MTTAYSGDGITFPDSTVQATAPRVGMVNRLINSDMRISQRNGGASVTPTNGQYTLDRWKYYSSQTSKVSIQQNASSVTPPAGFKNYLGVTSLSAYSVTASDYFTITQLVEGFNMADFGYGAAGASTVTLSFWVRSSLTGTFGGSLTNDAANYAYPFTYSISVANTWEQKSITITGATAGTWQSTNAAGIQVLFALGAGSTYSGTAGAWVAAGFLPSATGATSVVGTSGATFYLTGVQLEKGSTATDFEYVDYGRQLQMCQRYYQLAEGFNGTAAGNNTFMYCTMQFKTEMRANPSVSANANIQITYPGVNDYTQSSPSVSITAGRVSTRAIQLDIKNFSGLTYLSPLAHNVGVNNASITLSSEL